MRTSVPRNLTCLTVLLGTVCFSPDVAAQQPIADSLYLQAASRHNAGDSEAAIELYSHVIELDSTFTNAYWNRGLLRELAEDALPDYQKVTELAPQFGGGWGNYGWSQILLENLSVGRDASRVATVLEPTEYSWWLNLGHTFLLDDQIDSAYVFYDKALPGMLSAEDLRASQSDFDLFYSRSWRSDRAVAASAWLAEQFHSWRYPQIRSDSLWHVASALRDSSDHAGAGRTFELAAQTEQTGQRIRSRDVWLSYMNAGGAYAVARDEFNAIRAYKASLEVFGPDTVSVDHAIVLTEYLESLDLLKQDSLALSLYKPALLEAQQLEEDNLISRIASAAGNALSRVLRFEEALELHELALGINRELGHEANVEANLSNAAWALLQFGRFPEALRYYEEALAIAERLKRETLARRMRDVAAARSKLGDNLVAYDLYRGALRIAQDSGDLENEMVIGGNIGSVVLDWGRYDEALEWYQKVIEIARQLDDQWSEAIYLNNIGDVYDRWGRIDEAMSYYGQALTIATRRNDEASMSTFLNNLGGLHYNLHEFDTALNYLQRSLDINRRYGRKSREGNTLATIGMVYDEQGDADESIRYYEEARVLLSETGDKSAVSRIDNAIGLWHASRKDYDLAFQYYDRAFAMADSAGATGRLASVLHNRGITYSEVGRSDEAVADLISAISELERMRKTASFDVRRDYLQSQIGTYEILLIHLQFEGRARDALVVMGRMQARALEDKLADQERIPEDVTSIAGTEGVGIVNSFLSTSQVETDLSTLLNNQVVLNYGLVVDGLIPYVVVADADSASMATAALDSLKAGFPELGYNSDTALSQLVAEFRSLASRQVETRGAAAAAVRKQGRTAARRHEIGRLLYNALIQPIASRLDRKSELIIVPDGILAFVPFESLVRPDGSYLGEHFDIKYVQSLAIRRVTLDRNYPDSRKPMLAFGGAVYESNQDETPTESQTAGTLEVIQNTAYSSLNRGGKQTDSYATLGYSSWSNLPGTLEEVNAISDIVGSSTIVTGVQASEQTVKNLSASGELADFRVIHFATHGMVVPEVPELSALVLSQNLDGDEDGYLRMDEIADLKINADFVNLSACETGLGKLYGGEGVVGLTQSFILAGANGLSVSLWQVADESTSIFMEELYRLVAEQDLSYAAAISEVKRMFIGGDFGEQYRDPYYWAPFVYYGR